MLRNLESDRGQIFNLLGRQNVGGHVLVHHLNQIVSLNTSTVPTNMH